MITYEEFSDRFVDHFDAAEFKKDLVSEYSDEMLLYPLFYRNLVFRRLTDFGKSWDISELKEFPVGSILHLVDDNFLMNKPVVFVPDTTGWSMTREPYRKFMYHVTQPVNGPISNVESFVLPPNGLITTISNYRKRNQQFMRPCNTLEDIPGPTRTQVQTVVSYNSLYRARIFGLLREHRRFKYVFSNMINHICSQPQFQNRMHFIPIPVGDKQFDRNMFLRTFKAHVRGAIKYETDYWYLFCMHLFGFVHGGKERTPSIFEDIPKSMWDKIHFVLYSKNKACILRLDHLKEFNGENDTIMIRLIKLCNMLAESGRQQAVGDFADRAPVVDLEEDKSLPDVSPDTPFEEAKVNVTITKPEVKEQSVPVVAKPLAVSPVKIPLAKTTIQKSVVPVATNTDKPGNIEPSGQTTVKEQPKQVIQKISPEETKAKLAELEAEYESDIALKFDGITIDRKWLEIPEDATPDDHNAPEFIKPVPKQEQKAFNKALVVDLDRKAKEVIASHTELTAAQRTRAEKLAVAYKEVKIDNETLEEVLESTPDDSVNENNLDFLADQVEDPSMLNSSVQTFEHDYMNKIFKKDLIAELTSFNRVGMFLKDLKTEDASDALNSSTTYIAKYEDLNHKEHTIRFTLPNVDERGFCLVNGTLKVLKKQRVPNPICKVSNTRVTLNSDYNKYLVERNTTVAHSFIYYIDRLLKAFGERAHSTLGSHEYVNKLIPYEYTAIARKYTKMDITSEDRKVRWDFFFDYHNMLDILNKTFELSDEYVQIIRSTMDADQCTCFGISKDYKAAFVKLDGSVIVKDLTDDHTVETTTIIDLFCDVLGSTISGLNEWTDFKLLNKTVPTIFALCYRYGLTHILNYTNTKYRVYDKNKRVDKKASDVVIRFADKTLIIPRAPLVSSLLFAGLNNYDLRKINMEEMDNKDIYFELIQSKKISVHNLKGIDNFFDYFVDPITADVLHQMGEPTDPKDLLIRSTQLLSTEDHKPAASSSNFRFRSYERINSAVYKVLSRAHATFRHKAIGASNKFSIADYEIKQLVCQDQLMENVDLINPINDIKYQSEFSHAGFGGRQSIDTFMVDDRQFPEDGIGIISEATVDSSKTAYAASMTADPTMTNMRGMTVSRKATELGPAQLVSQTALLTPASLNNDGKRVNFISIHLSHYLPTKVMDPYRVRTTYERTVAHRTRPPFAYCAEQDGVIESIDDKAKILVVKYKDGNKTAVQFGDQFTNNGGGGFYCTQNIVINNFKVGDKVKRGDVIVYNEHFFTPDPYNKQVDWNMGTVANVACIETNDTLDDGNAISKTLADKLEFNPVHVRDVVLKKTTTVHKYASVGTVVNNTDPLLIFDQSEMTDDMFGKLDDEGIELLSKLNRQTPKAKFTGRIVKIDAFYKCPVEEMADGLKGIVAVVAREKIAKHKAAGDSSNNNEYRPYHQIKYTDRIGTTDLDNDTVILRFYIQQDMICACGDKIEFEGPFKSVNSRVQDDDWDVEDGSMKVHALFSSLGLGNRICVGPFLNGMTARVAEQLEKNILKMYFEE